MLIYFVLYKTKLMLYGGSIWLTQNHKLSHRTLLQEATQPDVRQIRVLILLEIVVAIARSVNSHNKDYLIFR